MTQGLPQGYYIRNADGGRDDAAAIAGLHRAMDESHGAAVWITVEDILEDWKHPASDPTTRSWLVLDEASGDVVANLEIYDNRTDGTDLELNVLVHPRHEGRGLQGALLDAGEAQMRTFLQERSLARSLLRSYLDVTETELSDALKERGYSFVRRFWHMEIEVPDGYDPGPPPSGIRIDPWRGEPEAEPFQAIIEETFADHYGWSPTPFKEWWQMTSEREGFDPSLSLVAREGDEVAAVSFNMIRGERGWVQDLGVREAWRGRGVGRALLQHSFATFKARGYAKTGLGVDSSNPTGAPALYQRAGMYVTREFDAFEKTLEA